MSLLNRQMRPPEAANQEKAHGLPPVFRWLIPTAALLLAYALGIHRLGVKDFWWDEAHSWSLAILPLAEAVRQGAAILNDPLYLIVLHFWAQIADGTAFGLRYLSLLVTVINAAYLGRVAAKAYNRRVGAFAALLGASSVLWIFYAQEVRQYALMPLSMLGMLDSLIDLERGRGSTFRPWVRLVIAETIGLYTHSFMLFATLGVHLVIGLIWLREMLAGKNSPRHRRDNWLWRWLTSQAGVLILSIPLIPIYLRRGLGELPESDLALSDLWYAAWHNWMGIPWEDAGGSTLLPFVSAGILLAASLGLLLHLMPQKTGHLREKHRISADLFWLIAGAAVSTLAFWLVNSKIHPRYLIMLSAPLFMLLAWVMVGPWQGGAARSGKALIQRGLGLILAGCWVGMSVLGLNALYTGATVGYRHDESRAMTGYLRDHLGADDGIITLDPYDYTVAFYDTGPAELFRAGFNEGYSRPEDLAAFMQGKEQIALVRFHVERSDTRQIAAFYLERFGTLIDRAQFEAYTVTIYRLDAGAQPHLVEFTPAGADWPGLALTGFSAHTGDQVTVALQWQSLAENTPGRRLAAVVRLVDPQTDWLLSSAAGLIEAEGGVTTDRWAAGQRGIQYLILPLQPGTPDLETAVQVTLVDADTGHPLDVLDTGGSPLGQTAVVGQVKTGGQARQDTYPDQYAFTLTPIPSAVVGGYATDWPAVAPGGKLGITLGWLVAPDQLTSEAAAVQLVQGDVILAEDNGPPLQGREPAAVPAGSAWLDHRVLQVSGEAQHGPADLVLRLGAEQLRLGTVEILGYQRITERPDISSPQEAVFSGKFRLLGFRLDVPEPFTFESTPVLTLYWQAADDGAPGDDYVVFTQILNADGQLIGQHDGVPAYGTRPMSGWLAGEYVIDEHPLTFKQPYAGPVQIQVGLYDPATFERLLTGDGLDAVILATGDLVVETTE